jgi:hypothetical protein
MRDLPPPSMAAGKGTDVAMEELTLSALTGDVDVNFKSDYLAGRGRPSSSSISGDSDS